MICKPSELGWFVGKDQEYAIWSYQLVQVVRDASVSTNINERRSSRNGCITNSNAELYESKEGESQASQSEV